MSNKMSPTNMQLIACSAASLILLSSHADNLFKIPENAAKELPSGVPRTVDTNGRVIYIEGTFTTVAYQREALRLLIQEANRVARDLQLHETLPITESNLTRVYIGPFGYNYEMRAIGNITTSNYWYFVKRDDKFSDLTVVDIDARCRDYAAHYSCRRDQLDTNGAFQLAAQWLSAANMDVQGLNRDYSVHVALDPYWNGLRMGEVPKRSFVPIYIVSWLPLDKPEYSAGSAAWVELFLPTKTLLNLSVENPKYILRPPLVFTNLGALFPGKGAVTTNIPTIHAIIDNSNMERN